MLGKSPKRLAGFCKKEYGERVAAGCLFLFFGEQKAINPGIWGRAPCFPFNVQKLGFLSVVI